jgi:phosphatidylglycerophosphate synthase
MHGRVLTIPNVLSVIRLVLLPVFAYLLLERQSYGPALAILIFSGASDWADGKIARLVANQSSRLGELLDPLVDRIYMVAVPVVLALAGVVPWWLVAVLLGRDALLAATLPVLRGRGVTDVDIVGIATDYCVRATAEDAERAGFGTRVLVDLTAGVAPESTAVALEQMRRTGVELVHLR